jgi:hypothetical protein
VKARDGGARDSRMGNNTGDLTWFGLCTRRSVMEPLARLRRYHRGQATRGRSTCDATRHTWCWATAAEETLTGRLVGGRRKPPPPAHPSSTRTASGRRMGRRGRAGRGLGNWRRREGRRRRRARATERRRRVAGMGGRRASGVQRAEEAAACALGRRRRSAASAGWPGAAAEAGPALDGGGSGGGLTLRGRTCRDWEREDGSSVAGRFEEFLEGLWSCGR